VQQGALLSMVKAMEHTPPMDTKCWKDNVKATLQPRRTETSIENLVWVGQSIRKCVSSFRAVDLPVVASESEQHPLQS
jgi:hypothetical protein